MLKPSKIQSPGSSQFSCGTLPWQRTQRTPSKVFSDWLTAVTLTVVDANP